MGGPSIRRSVTRKLTAPRAAWMGNSHGTQHGTGGDGKPSAVQNCPCAMPIATRSPWALAHAGRLSPDRGDRKGLPE